jgi:hypothetical protein
MAHNSEECADLLGPLGDRAAAEYFESLFGGAHGRPSTATTTGPSDVATGDAEAAQPTVPQDWPDLRAMLEQNPHLMTVAFEAVVEFCSEQRRNASDDQEIHAEQRRQADMREEDQLGEEQNKEEMILHLPTIAAMPNVTVRRRVSRWAQRRGYETDADSDEETQSTVEMDRDKEMEAVDTSAAPTDNVPPAAPTTGSVHEAAGATTTNGKWLNRPTLAFTFDSHNALSSPASLVTGLAAGRRGNRHSRGRRASLGQCGDE